ncbi:MAG TPA: hypothetical protein VFJ30_06115, partial [Phycisphaerae bacterium]|nr:hypothetical protein [Phycisphaerae bacterium]
AAATPTDPDDKTKGIVFMLMRYPDGRWRAMDWGPVPGDLKDPVGRHLGSIDVGGRFRRKVFDEAGKKTP